MSDILVVASKIKKHVKETYDLRTSIEALEAMSVMIVEACSTAAQAAKEDGRKTIQARDLVSVDVTADSPDEVAADLITDLDSALDSALESAL